MKFKFLETHITIKSIVSKKMFRLNDAKKSNSGLCLSLQFFKKSNGYSRSIDDWETRGNYKYTTQVA